jgi:hypothetical protein
MEIPSLQDDGSEEAMKIKSHSESHIVDGSRWQIFPGDLLRPTVAPLASRREHPNRASAQILSFAAN